MDACAGEEFIYKEYSQVHTIQQSKKAGKAVIKNRQQSKNNKQLGSLCTKQCHIHINATQLECAQLGCLNIGHNQLCSLGINVQASSPLVKTRKYMW